MRSFELESRKVHDRNDRGSGSGDFSQIDGNVVAEFRKKNVFMTIDTKRE